MKEVYFMTTFIANLLQGKYLVTASCSIPVSGQHMCIHVPVKIEEMINATGIDGYTSLFPIKLGCTGGWKSFTSGIYVVIFNPDIIMFV